MLTAILVNDFGKPDILFFNHDERIFDLQIIPFGWSLIEIVKRDNWHKAQEIAEKVKR